MILKLILGVVVGFIAATALGLGAFGIAMNHVHEKMRSPR